MKITGYAWNASAYCVRCTHYAFFRDDLQRIDPHSIETDEHNLPQVLHVTETNEQVGVIFDSSEADYLQTCDVCHAEIDTIIISKNLTFRFC